MAPGGAGLRVEGNGKVLEVSGMPPPAYAEAVRVTRAQGWGERDWMFGWWERKTEGGGEGGGKVKEGGR